jgi:hypothetical protein
MTLATTPSMTSAAARRSRRRARLVFLSLSALVIAAGAAAGVGAGQALFPTEPGLIEGRYAAEPLVRIVTDGRS